MSEMISYSREQLIDYLRIASELEGKIFELNHVRKSLVDSNANLRHRANVPFQYEAKEAKKIDSFIEMILFYARSQMPEKDYMIKKCKLSDIVNRVIVRNKNSFLEKSICLNMHDLDVLVRTDSKWMEFIINQIIVNSIKYVEDNPLIEIYSESDKESISLIIRDNGIGINSKDLPRVFDKGFTGENGRSKYNSTGMGLYLVKKLCLALGNNVLTTSTEGEGTTLKIVFPLGSFTDKMIGDEKNGFKSKE